MEEVKGRDLLRRHSTDVRMNPRFGPTHYWLREEYGRSSDRLLPWSDHLSVLLCGTRDEGSPFRLLRGFESTLVRGIYETVVESWREHILLTPPAYSVARFRDSEGRDDNSDASADYDKVEKRGARIPVTNFLLGMNGSRSLGNRVQDRPLVAFARCNRVEFPSPRDRNVNMLPFILGRKESLPENLQPYYDLVSRCPVSEDEVGNVCYLTVCESLVNAGKTQRRPGLHTEAPGSIKGPDGTFTAAWEHHWGMGMAYTADNYKGGLFIASNLDKTCELWDALIDPAGGISDSQGGVEHLRPFLGEGTKLRAGELVWLTDRTPHQALPQKKDGYRQFFRLVTSAVTLWYEAHSTPNPKVPLPKQVKVIKGSKFHKGTVEG